MSTTTTGSRADGAPHELSERVRHDLVAFLEQRTKSPVAVDVDLFAAGLVSSLFALELVVHLESTFGVAVAGPELTLDNFRTVEAMAALVVRLSGPAGG
ncbi:MAG TPA: phosphopantetheine-binding protein [Umezawaea sp.]|nr:phosphopantetheine-binding protein [Umezawaea sp.]